ncbi:protein-tyrosine-phosphatase mkp1 [Phtheirospermum japonicum]|uniref:Protein-tyrosine-phosphatase mkp1 n=1 Tax=Phtheirospermum japonicum TaxID=374723 RepID=A0A830BN79_9LAMI|nr:protein-tyrosine-phosphatase mkp1 [Phtheirospermum japonicum]
MTPREHSSSSDLEFECRKDKLAFFDKECSKILDHIYLGSDVIAKNRETLRLNKITHVLNCVGFSCAEYFKNELVYKTLWLQDCPSEDITSILYDVFDYFEDVRELGGRVFVHCCHGVSRSTSLVIAYLMWKNGQNFDDAFEFVKKARGVTNPNVGFACQLLQCQKRVHAQPASPGSVLRMYRMAPHSPYDPLHLVPKLLSEPGPDKLDPRGSFIVHVPFGLYVWIGKLCSALMSENAVSAASQVIRYEKAQGPIVTVKEGEETFAFWDAFGNKKGLDGQREQLDEYDLDFEIFNRAVAGGVVPAFPLSEAGPETCVPVRENGWNGYRKTYVDGILKDFIASSKLESSASQAHGSPCGSPDSFASYVTSNSLKEVADTFSSFSFSSSSSSSSSNNNNNNNNNNKTLSNLTSPSVSPSASDNSSSFTSSPSSSNWSDLSFVSSQSSPYAEKNNVSVDESACLVTNNVTNSSTSQEKAIFGCRVSRTAGLCLSTSSTNSPSLAERRGMKLLPSIDESSSQVSENLTRLQDEKRYVAFIVQMRKMDMYLCSLDIRLVIHYTRG